MGALPQHVAAEIAEHLDAIGALFKQPKITLLVRNDVGPQLDADLVMTNDELPLAIAALQHRHDVDKAKAPASADAPAPIAAPLPEGGGGRPDTTLNGTGD